jgi:dephospho-CoA kinase
MLRVGLTGGIACGKSTVAARFAAAGCATLDLDRLGHHVMRAGAPAYAPVVEAFGNGILGPRGAIDRKVLARRVFSEPGALARLNSIVHPFVRQEEERIAACQTAEVLVTEAALLVETGGHLRYNRLIVVHADADTQVDRICARDGLGRDAALQRIQAQMPLALKRTFAHYVVDTASPLRVTDAAADALARDLLELSRRRPAPVRVDAARLRAALSAADAAPDRIIQPRELLLGLAQARGLDLPHIAKLARPRLPGPWYAPAIHDSPQPECAAWPLAAWCLARAGDDDDFVIAAASSLARVIQTDSRSSATLCLSALVAMAVLAHGLVPAALRRLSEWQTLTRRWVGESPAPLVALSLRAALAHTPDIEATRRAAQHNVGDGSFAAVLVALGTGARTSEQDPRDARAADAFTAVEDWTSGHA